MPAERQDAVSALVLDFAVDPRVADRIGDRLPPGAQHLRLADLRRLGAWGTLSRLLRERFEICSIIVNDHRAQGRWISILALALLARARRRVLVDPEGKERPLSWGSFLGTEIPFAWRRAKVSARLRRQVLDQVRQLAPAGPPRSLRPQRVAFLRADLGPPLSAGGSLAHIRGVVVGLQRRGVDVTFVSPAPVHGIGPEGDRLRIVPPDDAYRLSSELPPLAYNLRLLPRAMEILRERKVELVYHRHTLGGYAAALAAQRSGLPLVVEFNGSEVWIARHWGEGLAHARLFAEIERRALQAADLVVAVSEPLRAQLREAGVDDDRILVNPNGVDVERFDAAASAQEPARVRRRLGVDDGEVLAGFVGTFGAWHGAEVLARAAALLEAATARRMRLLFVGDGPRRPRTEEILREAGLSARAIFAGMVPQDETPPLLAACDLCVSPHVPNPDGTPFFGSPTKLFEYMACGRPIVASRLDQIGEVLEHGRNAWLVAPGDPEALARGLERLAADPELGKRLAAAARSDASTRHSWSAHVERILERLADPACR